MWPCIANIFSEFNQEDATFLKFIYFCKTLYIFQTGFPSIIRSSKLYLQRQAFVRLLLLPAAGLTRLAAGSSNGLTDNNNNNNNNNTSLIDIAVPNTHNLAKTITDTQKKYQELANEICSMWKQNVAQVIPIVISSTGVIPKSLSQSLTRLNLHPNTYIQLQKSVILGTCSFVRNFLNYK
jgi:hypothetical protein